MKILVVAAMPNELKAIKEWIKSADLKVNLDINYLCCGIWNYETVSSLKHYLTQHPELTFILNIWICGYWNPNNEEKTESIQVASVLNIHTEKEMIIPPFLQLAPLRNCFSGENVIINKPEFKKRIWTVNDEMYFDMESRWVEFVASKYKYPRLILKVPFDLVWGDESVKEKDYKKLAERIDKLLKSLPYHDYLEKILEWIDKQ